ncbi:hypothetical protein D3C78_1045280 [compost metagenome]
MDNGMDYTILDGVGYQVLNPEVGQVDMAGKVSFLKPESLKVNVSFQGVTEEHLVNYEHYVKVFKVYVKSLDVDENGDEFSINLKTSARKINSTPEYITALVSAAEKIGIYTIKETQEDSIRIVFNKK